ncbi:unannotated protein [freshwater metagenome]|uniref:Unannotated protein n=1 Tax=freshwater metagenome TaxID=449393 RepID=A0A6J6ZFN1_9ZZZZ
MPMRYREVIRMPLWLLALIYFFFLSFVVSVWAALENIAALVALLVVTSLLLRLAFTSALVIEINGQELRVGRAHISLSYIKNATALTVHEMKNIRTRDADPAAYLAIRFWNANGVKVVLDDPRDSTPYWVITSKQSEELAEILNSQRG